tara:strand:- start:4102 stop:5109 length:1008 start_codon:yes stop_codon:yes gene_type:complete
MAKDLVDGLMGILGETTNKTLEVPGWIDTGFPPLNEAIQGSFEGGFPEGRITEMFGAASCGKTAIATCAMADAIRKGGFGLFMDAERSFDINLARKLGLDDTQGRFAHVKPETFEEAIVRTYKAAEALRENPAFKEDAPIVVVFDSLAAMIPKSKWEKDADENTMADKLALASATSQTFPVLNQKAEKYRITVLVLNQLRESPSPYGDSEKTPGGKAPAFFASLRIKLSSKRIVDKKDKKIQIGHVITARCIKNKVSAPFKETTWNFMYETDGTGRFDIERGLVDHAAKFGFLEKSGNYLIFDGKKKYPEAVAKMLREDPKLYEDLIELCRIPIE